MYGTVELHGVDASLAMMGLRLSAAQAVPRDNAAIAVADHWPLFADCSTHILHVVVGAARCTVMLLVWAGALAARPLSRAQ
jgi:hypothetical protein